jgi:hypothetical protein
MVRGLGSFVLVGGCNLLDGDEFGVPRTAIAHAHCVGFRRLSPMEGEGATPIRRPCAVIVANDGLGFAVAKCDVVDGQSGIPPEGGWISIRRMEIEMIAPTLVASREIENFLACSWGAAFQSKFT